MEKYPKTRRQAICCLLSAFLTVGAVFGTAANPTIEDVVVSPNHCHDLGGGTWYCCSGNVADGSWECGVILG